MFIWRCTLRCMVGTMTQEKSPQIKNVDNIDRVKLKEFKGVLKNSSFSELDKKNIEFTLEYFQGKHDPEISSRSFLLYGDTGIGKTYLTEKLLQAINTPILYMSCNDFSFSQGIRYSGFKEFLSKAKQEGRQILFFDDLGYLLSRDQMIFHPDNTKIFMEILELVKKNPDKLLIATMNTMKALDERMMDRIEVKIRVEIPTNQNKLTFLDSCFHDHLTRAMRAFISKNSIGYNYRDVPEVIKLAYRLGENRVTMSSLKQALRIYQPTQLYGYKVENAVDVNLKDVIGKSKAITVMKRLIQVYKNDVLCDQLKLRRGNLLMFYGLPGTGKSFMARALAGEIGFPLINIEGRTLQRGDALRSIGMITDMAKRYRNCIIFIDEAEKLFGNPRFGADNPILGELHRCIDGVDGEDIQSIFIFAINDLSRFGQTLLDRFVLVEFVLPAFEDRMTFFAEKIALVRPYVSMETTSRELALHTENMSYRDLDRFWNDLMFSYIEETGGDADEMAHRIANQLRAGNQCEIMFG